MLPRESKVGEVDGGVLRPVCCTDCVPLIQTSEIRNFF